MLNKRDLKMLLTLYEKKLIDVLNEDHKDMGDYLSIITRTKVHNIFENLRSDLGLHGRSNKSS